LIAEDNQLNQILAMKLFEKIGINVDLAVDGQEASEKAKQSPYDFIFMDLQMPIVGGIDATIEILSADSSQYKPIIIAMTANVFEEDKRQCLEVGMVDLVAKPLSIDLLAKAINNNKDRIEKRVSQRIPTGSGSGSSSSSGPSSELHTHLRESLAILSQIFW